jgi:putative tryptophan/tyrosine transport system substrate-binding protein
LKRRSFITLLGGATTWPLAAPAQQPRVLVVGYLQTVSAQASERPTAAFRSGLTERGFEEGRQIVFEYRYANGNIERLPGLATDLVNLRVNVIAAVGGSKSALAAKAATTTIPIVFTMGDADPVTTGVVVSLARPGGNATGISLLGGVLGAKRLDLALELVPSAATVGVFLNPENLSTATEAQELQRGIEQRGRKAVLGALGSI